MKASINLENLYVEYPFHDVDSSNIRKLLLHAFKSKKTRSSNSFTRVHALKNISFRIGEGERVGLIGTNGSGKTTLLKVLAGILYPSAGSMKITGNVGSIFDPNLGMDPEASGIENIKIRCMFLRIKKSHIPQKIEYISAFSELGDALRRPLKTYSAGMAMRLAFSIATCVEPEILIMDEWLSAGDARFVSKALTKMQDLVKQSRILVLASHSEQILTTWCSRVLWIQDGCLLADSDPASVFAQYNEYVNSTQTIEG